MKLLLVVATATVLAACGTDRPAPSDAMKQIPAPATSPDAAALPATAETKTAPAVEPKATPAPAPMKRSEPPSPATRPVPAATPAVATPSTPTPATAPAAPPPVVAAAPSAPHFDPLTGKPAYDLQCRKCHGVIGVPPKVIQAKFPKIRAFDAEFFGKRTDDSVVTVLLNGNGEAMKSFKEKLSRAEMGAVAAYIRTLGQKP